MATRKNEIDMCNGPLFGKILLFTIPLVLSSVLQLLFNAADMVVVGKFVGDHALAAVGATGALINLLLNVFIGFSVGTNVLVARYYGAGLKEEIQETIHTSVGLALVSGVFLTLVGLFASRSLLIMTGTPADVLEQATLYMRIYFVGMPVSLLYNFGSAILRAVGDTRRPLYYLAGAGVANVLLNLALVILAGMGVEGVASATVTSQAISAALVIRCLVKSEEALHLDWRKLGLFKEKLIRIAKIGIPASIQAVGSNMTHVLLQSSINSFGAIAMAGSTAASNIEGFIWFSMNACHQSAVSFVSQNMGARKMDRIGKSVIQCLGLVVVIGLFMGVSICFFGEQLLGIYITDPEAKVYGMAHLSMIGGLYFLCGIADTLVGSIRGLGNSAQSMVIYLTGACGLRIVWIFTVFRWFRSWKILLLSYPVSWAITSVALLICLISTYRTQKRLLHRA